MWLEEKEGSGLWLLLTLFAVAPLFVVGGDAPRDFEVRGRLAVELAVGSRFGQREVAAGGRLAGLQLGGMGGWGAKKKGQIQSKQTVNTPLSHCWQSLLGESLSRRYYALHARWQSRFNGIKVCEKHSCLRLKFNISLQWRRTTDLCELRSDRVSTFSTKNKTLTSCPQDEMNDNLIWDRLKRSFHPNVTEN